MNSDRASGERLPMMADLVLPMSVISRGAGCAAAHSSTSAGMLRTGVEMTTRSA